MQDLSDKQHRQSTLAALLEKRQFAKQEEVVAAMEALGFGVTQPSISRDFRELGVAKIDGRYQVASSASARGGNLTLRMILGVESVGANMVVVTTTPGAASVVAATIDTLGLDGVVGSIAGDDTIFIAVRGSEYHEDVLMLLSGSEVDGG